MIIDLLFS